MGPSAARARAAKGTASRQSKGRSNRMKKLSARIASYLLLAALPMLAADNGKAPHPRKEKVFHWSLVATWLSASADVTTSLIADGRPRMVESDLILGKRFGARGIALEFGSRGILEAVEIFVLRRHPGAVTGSGKRSVESWLSLTESDSVAARSSCGSRLSNAVRTRSATGASLRKPLPLVTAQHRHRKLPSRDQRERSFPYNP